MDDDDDDDDDSKDGNDEGGKKPKSTKPEDDKKDVKDAVGKKPSAIFSKTATCCICLEIPTEEELSTINGCDHPYCFTCIETWAYRENTCPLCKSRFTKIEKVNHKKAGKRKRGGECGSGEKSSGRKSKRVRNRNQRADVSLINPLQGYLGKYESSGMIIGDGSSIFIALSWTSKLIIL